MQRQGSATDVWQRGCFSTRHRVQGAILKNPVLVAGTTDTKLLSLYPARHGVQSRWVVKADLIKREARIDALASVSSWTFKLRY
eukprot:1177127-Prorocentrum_minimum.AAC.3